MIRGENNDDDIQPSGEKNLLSIDLTMVIRIILSNVDGGAENKIMLSMRTYLFYTTL